MGTHETQRDYWTLMRTVGIHEIKNEYWILMRFRETNADQWGLMRL